jgi:D-alanyl-D-alanine carboxypeptidase/D-alanyl-D-alanine-endopeptidase (penicillin-binding protein 4)
MRDRKLHHWIFAAMVGGAVVCAQVGWAQAASGVVAPQNAQVEMEAQIATLISDPAVSRSHWGIAVTGLDGTPVYGLNEGQFFQPASNAKLFTTAAALALLGPTKTFETRVVAKGVLDGSGRLTGDVVLVGGGDANLSGREMPYGATLARPKRAGSELPSPEADPLRYLAAMADQVAATGLKVVSGDVVGDDTLFPWEPYGIDWTIDDTFWDYGAPVSALTINDNRLKVTVTPGAAMGDPATVAIDPAVPYYMVDASGLVTGAAKSVFHLQMERELGSKVLRVYGSIAVKSKPDVEEVAIHDPAEYAAVAMKGMLEARGIVVKGVARAKHRRASDADEFTTGLSQPEREGSAASQDKGPQKGGCMVAAHPAALPAQDETVLASHRSGLLQDDLVVTNKVSQNLHAELFLHDLGRRIPCSDGSAVAGARQVRAFLVGKAGLDKDDFVFYDGSGLSGHDLVTPRATVKLLQYASAQPWFAAWKKSLPVGGVDGSLEGRFAKELKGKVFAKTGTLGETRALSGYLECASGQTVAFSIFVGNHAPGSTADREVMDKIIAAIAAAN